MRPITPQPGFTEADVKAILASKRFAFADTYTILNVDYEVFRYTNTQRDIVIEEPVEGGGLPLQYNARQAVVSGLKLKTGIGVEVDEQVMRLDLPPTPQYRGIPMPLAFRYGWFDGGVVRRDRYIAESLSSPWAGGFPLFVGRVSTTDKVGRDFAQVRVKSELVLLKTSMPRKLFQPSCLNTIFDAGCKLRREDHQATGIVGAGSNAGRLYWAGADATYLQGTVFVEDAGGATLVRTVDFVGAGYFDLSYPLDVAPAIGTNFTVSVGCSRLYTRCTALGNTDNFQGFPFVPVSEVAY